ncbi:MAG: SCO family protein [Rubripirellula sp.]|nr:SCO family protein [Rubripirellula sp.]
MKTIVHVGLILMTGVVLGLLVRFIGGSSKTIGPSDAEVIYSNDLAADGLTQEEVEGIENPEVSHPPDGETWLSRFELIERSGELVSSDDLLGSPYVVSFFFSTCPSICVQQNQKVKELQEEFEGKGVRFIAISVDPERDTPEQLREYAARFNADAEQWLFLTGDLNYIRRVGAEVYRQPVNKQFHTERFVLVDPAGEIEGFYNWPEPVQFEKLKQKINDYLEAEKA